LTPRRRPKERENSDYAEMNRRLLRAHGRRVADGDPDDLAELLALVPLLDEIIRDAIVGQRERHGFSWTDIGRAAGMTRQGAQQRWGERPGPATSI
jgi:hypothetical protein